RSCWVRSVCGSEYILMGRYTNFNFGAAVASAIWKQTDVTGLSKIGPGWGYGMLDDHDVLYFIDNHDNQGTLILM
ncbi:hypothetical protein PENTCL1PPCAC_3475, partial [Pristionchus entomophagus]